MEGEGLEEGEVGDGVGDLAGDVGGDEVESDDAVGFAVALDDVPVAAVGVGIPWGEVVGVAEGCFDFEEDLFVLRVAPYGEREWSLGEEGEEREEGDKC